MKKQSLLKSSQRIAEWLQMYHKFVHRVYFAAFNRFLMHFLIVYLKVM